LFKDKLFMARDLFHDLVKQALINDVWTVTHDPYPLHTRKEGSLSTDLGAERIIFAETRSQKIAVEVKSFIHISILHDFLLAVGQFYVYNKLILKSNADRILYVALPDFVYNRIIKYDWAREVIEDLNMKFILYDTNLKSIVAWKD
jgi:XisH protein